MLLLSCLFLLLGLAGLVFGADWLVDGASALARRFRISPLVIGLTVIAYGTSAPEIGASLVAVLRDSPGLAVGNVIGSNAANIGLILGATALMRSFAVKWEQISREFIYMLGATLLLWPMAAAGEIGRGIGVLFVVLLLVFNFLSIRWNRKAGVSPVAEGELPAAGRSPLFLGLGLGTLLVGAELLVRGASDLARALGASEITIGFTVVALGTSLPELATSVAAARRNEIQIVVGNVVGSNVFNVLGALGISAVVAPVAVDPRVLAGELPGVVLLTLLGGIFLWSGRKLTRLEGGILLAAYAAYVGWVIL